MRAPAPALPFALLAGLAAFALAAFAPGLLHASDTYWHISAGQWILAHHQLLRACALSSTSALAAALAGEAVMEAADRPRATLLWGLFLLAAVAACLLTPFGLQTLLFPLYLTAMAGIGHIGEWQASNFTTLSPFAIALLVTIGA